MGLTRLYAIYIFSALLCLCLSPHADTIYLQSGATVRGQILSFDGQRYRVQLEGETVTYEAAEIRGFAIERTATPQESPQQWDQVIRRLDAIDYKLNNFTQSYQTDTARIQQRVFDLNPVSQVRILSQEGRQEKDGSYLVRGRLVNESNQWVRSFRLRATLYDASGNALSTVEGETLSGEIGPGATKSFSVSFPKTPANIGRVEVVPYLPTRPSEQDIGGYQQQNPGVQRLR